jgi:hypothetical protein
MADRSYRGLWAAVNCCLVTCLVGCTTMTAGVNAVGPSPAPPVPASAAPTSAGDVSALASDVPPKQVRVLQLNLCNSGIASCYTGRSVAEAAELIRAETPDLVTLNEVCNEDVAALERAMAEVVPGGAVSSGFQAARDGISGQPYPCSNGQQFGVGVVARWPSLPGSSPNTGIYPAQDPKDPEERAWLCMDVAAAPPVSVCTTHLAYTDRQVTLDQCRYLFDTVIAGMRERDGAPPVVLGADLNFRAGDRCLPDDAALVDDGDVQHVVATPEFVVDSSREIDLRNSDHPGLLVRLTPREDS